MTKTAPTADPLGNAQSIDSTSSARATWMAIGAIVLWCWSGVCFAKGARAIGAMPYLTLMTAVGVMTVAALQVWRRRPLLDLVRLPVRVMVAGFFGVALYTVILAEAIGMASDAEVGLVALMNYLWPIWIVLIGLALLDERPRRLPVIVGALLGFAGVAIAKGPSLFTSPPSSLLPHAMALTGGFLWALYSVLLRRWRVPAEQGGTAFHFAICSLMAAVIASWRGEWSGATLTPSVVFWILLGGVGPVGLAYHWWEIGVKRGSVHLIATLAYFIPIVSTALMCLFFRETLSAWLVAAAILITAGASLAKRATTEAN